MLRGLFVDELGQALSQVVQVVDLDVQDLDHPPHLALRLLPLLLAGGQGFLSALDPLFELGVPRLQLLQKNIGRIGQEWMKDVEVMQTL